MTSSLCRRVAFLPVLALGVALVAGGVFSRVEEWSRIPALLRTADNLFAVATLVAVAWLALRRNLVSLVALVVALLGGAVFAHSFANIYWPSLRKGVPLQDYSLAATVSAHYSFHWVKIYLSKTLAGVLIGLAAADAFPLVSRRTRQGLGALAGVALGVNVFVIFVQRYVTKWFLVAGSGSALKAHRSPGLFEDSGASSVWMAGAASALLFLMIRGRHTRKSFWSLAAVTAVVLAAAASAGGRIVFVNIALCSIVAVAFEAPRRWRESDSRRRAQMVAGSLAFVAATVALPLVVGILGKHRDLLRIEDQWEQFHVTEGGLGPLLVQLDDIRAVHMQAMMRAFFEHKLVGTGLGLFYATLSEHAAWATRFGGHIRADVPASMYLMLASEIGLTGLLLIALSAAGVWRALRRPPSVEPSCPLLRASSESWKALGTGIALSLAISFLIGVHVIFWSVAGLLGFAVFAAWIGRGEARRSTLAFAGALASGTLLLLGAAGVRYLTAPRAPLFRWAETGVPQIPHGAKVPIRAPPGGRWLVSGAELVYAGAPMTFYVELPPEYYPFTVTLDLYGPDEQILGTEAHAIEKRRWLPKKSRLLPGAEHAFAFPAVDPAKLEVCRDPTPGHFCSVRLWAEPTWKYKKQPVGAYLLGAPDQT